MTRQEEFNHFIKTVDDNIKGANKLAKFNVVEIAKEWINIIFQYQPHENFPTVDSFLNSNEFQKYLMDRKKKQIKIRKQKMYKDFV